MPMYPIAPNSVALDTCGKQKLGTRCTYFHIHYRDKEAHLGGIPGSEPVCPLADQRGFDIFHRGTYSYFQGLVDSVECAPKSKFKPVTRNFKSDPKKK